MRHTLLTVSRLPPEGYYDSRDECIKCQGNGNPNRQSCIQGLATNNGARNLCSTNTGGPAMRTGPNPMIEKATHWKPRIFSQRLKVGGRWKPVTVLPLRDDRDRNAQLLRNMLER